MDDDLNVIGVLRSHLEEMHAALSNARTYHEAQDLIESVRTGKPNVRASWLSRELNRATQHVEGYLAVEVDDVRED